MPTESVWFGVLGPFQCATEHGGIIIDRAKPRAVLMMLVVHANTTVSASRLIDDLWEGNPPPSAANTLQTYVHALRSVLPSGTLMTRDGGYELVVDPGQIDAREFEHALHSVRGASTRRRAASLRAALNLWRGAPLADFADLEWARPEAARLSELRLNALEQCIEAELQLGQETAVIGELTELVREYPFRERFSALLMLALYRRGRQADALRVYEQLRHVLVEELGIEPSAPLVELEHSILVHAPELDAPLGAEEIHVPLSARVLACSCGPFVGRAFERKTLQDAFKDVVAGEPAAVLVGGEPGIGKTSLAAHLARAAFDSGAAVLYGHSEADLAIPFQPWAEALSHLVAHAPVEILDAHAAVHGGVLTHLVPELVERVDVEIDRRDDPPQRRLFGAVVDLLARVGEVAPVVLFLDDVHWADQASLDLLHFVTALDRSLRVFVLATFRSSEVGSRHAVADLLVATTRLPSVQYVLLDGLNADELLALVEATTAMTGPEARADFRDALMRETDGNPFFTIEILRHLTSTGVIAEGAADLRIRALPVGVQQVINNRVARLGDETARTLQTASVLGRDFDLEILAEVVERDHRTLTILCEQAVEAAVLTRTEAAGRYAFAHALFQHSLNTELGATRRQQLHLRIAQVLEDVYGDVDAHVPELAYHWLAATRTADRRRALYYANRAGDHALAALAPDDAVRWYRQALRLLDDLPADAHATGMLLVGLGRAQMMAADGEARTTLRDAARLAERSGTPDVLIAAALAAARGDFNQAATGDADFTDVTLAALAAAGDVDSSDRVRLLAALMEHTAGHDWELARDRANAAVAAARRLGDERLLMETITTTYVARAQPDTLATRLDDTERALVTADAIGEPLDRISARFIRHVALLEAADVDQANRLIDEMEEIATSAGVTLPHTRFRILMARAGRCLLAGDHASAEQAALGVLALGEVARLTDALTAGGALLGMIGWEQGRISESIDGLTAAMEQHPDFTVLRAAVAFYDSELGRFDDSARLVDRERASDFSEIPFDINWTTSMTLFADCVATIRDRDARVDLTQQARAVRRLEQLQRTDVARRVEPRARASLLDAGRRRGRRGRIRAGTRTRHATTSTVRSRARAARLCRTSRAAARTRSRARDRVREERRDNRRGVPLRSPRSPRPNDPREPRAFDQHQRRGS